MHSNKKNFKLFFTVFIFLITLFVLYHMFKDSYQQIFLQLKNINILQIFIVLLLSLGYLLIEGVVISVLINGGKSFSKKDGIETALVGSFYRGITLGVGAQFGQIHTLNKKNISPGDGLSTTTLMYVFQKLSVAIYAFILYIGNYTFLSEHFKPYLIYLNIAFILTMITSLIMFLLCTSKLFHGIILKILHILVDRFHKKTTLLVKVESELNNLRSRSSKILNKNLVFKVILMQMFKLTCWYLIPAVTFYHSTGSLMDISLIDILSLSSFLNAVVGVIPTTGGMLSTELLFVLLFSVVFGEIQAKSSMIIYRVSTFFFPFIIGTLYYFSMKLIRRN